MAKVAGSERLRTAVFTFGDLHIRFRRDADSPQIWATQKQMSEIFGRHVSTIGQLVRAILDGKEVDRTGFRSMSTLTGNGRTYDVLHYNTDVVLGVAARVGALEAAAALRKWLADLPTVVPTDIEVEESAWEKIDVDAPPPEGQELVIFNYDGRQIRLGLDGSEQQVWLSQKALAGLFQKSVPTINEHIGQILQDEVIDRNTSTRRFRITASDGKTYEIFHYNIDVVLAVAMRLQASELAIRFQRWVIELVRHQFSAGRGRESLAMLPGPDETLKIKLFLELEVQKPGFRDAFQPVYLHGIKTRLFCLDMRQWEREADEVLLDLVIGRINRGYDVVLMFEDHAHLAFWQYFFADLRDPRPEIFYQRVHKAIIGGHGLVVGDFAETASRALNL